MRPLFILSLVFFTINGATISQVRSQSNCQGCTQRGEPAERIIKPGIGQEYTKKFIDPTCMHYVQFAVYPATVNCKNLKAPEGLGEIWLIKHPGTRVLGEQKLGGIYIVKAFLSKSQAKAYAQQYNRKGIECWYNPELTATKITVLMYYLS